MGTYFSMHYILNSHVLHSPSPFVSIKISSDETFFDFIQIVENRNELERYAGKKINFDIFSIERMYDEDEKLPIFKPENVITTLEQILYLLKQHQTHYFYSCTPLDNHFIFYNGKVYNLTSGLDNCSLWRNEKEGETIDLRNLDEFKCQTVVHQNNTIYDNYIKNCVPGNDVVVKINKKSVYEVIAPDFNEMIQFCINANKINAGITTYLS